MTKTLAQIQKQIDSLEREAEALKKKEVAGVIARIKEAIREYDLSAADLGLGKASRAKKTAMPRKAASGKVKFKDASGRTWTGHGRRPQWFIDAMAAGTKPEDLLA